MDEAAQVLFLQRRELAKQMLLVEPGSPEMKELLDREAAIVQQIQAAGIDLSSPDIAYGVAYGVLEGES